jgi:signal transduction histidine kinase
MVPATTTTNPGAKQARAILAINSRGTVTKANLQAKRALSEGEGLEGEELGSLLAAVLSERKAQSLQLLFSEAQAGPRPVLLVLSDGHHVEEAAEGRGPATGAAVKTTPSEYAVGEFIAHELRNDIAIILGLSQLMVTSFESIDRRDRLAAFKGIQSEAEHAQLVLDGLLRLAEQRSRPEAIRTRVPVHAVLERAISRHSRRHPGRRFLLSGDSPLFAIANSNWLELAFLNLLTNAEKVTPPDQPIEVVLSHEGSHCIILVLDKGQGLPAEVYSALWSIRTEGPPPGLEVTGSGIGLSLCKALVEAMGGRVWAGPRPGGGSAFTLSLPLPSEPTTLESLAA